MSEKNRSERVIGLVAIFVAVIALGVGFAAYSQTLTINGSGEVKASSWQVRFENLSEASTTGTALETTAPTINTNDTNIGEYDVSFQTPGDSISYTFDIANNGTFDAEISSISIPTPECTGNGSNATTDAQNVCSNLEYKLTYTDGGATVSQSDTLNHGEKKNVTLTLTYKDTITAEQLPTDDVNIDNLGINIIYSQK